jgi:lipoprotein-anchoring transpeptidase ErfK/SrfK
MAHSVSKLSGLAAAALLASCGPAPKDQATETNQTTTVTTETAASNLMPATPLQPEAPAQLAAGPAELPADLQAVNLAVFTPGAEDKPAAAPTGRLGAARMELIRAQTLLDRAHFSPGEIDGLSGSNQQVAIAAYEAAHGLPVDGKLDAAVWKALTDADSGPVLVNHTITATEVAGPFISAVPEEIVDAAKLPALGYTNPAEALAEQFHMSPALLKALNPEAAFSAGEAIVVVAGRAPLQGVEVASVEVDRAARMLRAYDASGKLVAAYPASVGSTDMPAPSGTWAVKSVAPAPVYYYDPSRLNFGKQAAKEKLKVAAGPNNPVGSTWIDLTKDTYGIHGTPDPETIGKHQSHGCVRLTNWDAAELGKIIKKGAKVAFLNANTAKRAVG